jgi:hypothetical protein
MFTGSLAVQRNINSSNVAGALLLLLVAMLVGCVIAPQNGRNAAGIGGVKSVETPIQRTAFSGTPETVGYYYFVNPDCTSGGMPVVTITQAVSHGSLLIQNDAKHYSAFPSTNQRYECNKRKNPSAGVVYTSEKAFVGTDGFSVKVVFPDGSTRSEHFVVSVEQPPKDQPGVVLP